MKVYIEGEKGQALCHKDGAVSITYAYRDVPFRDGKGVAPNILAGACDTCGETIVIPAQSTPAISMARKRVEHSLEVNIPAFYVDILDAAATRVAPHASTEFRKPLLTYYIDRYARQKEDLSELKPLYESFVRRKKASKSPKKRLSMKLSAFANSRFNDLAASSDLNKTELIKSLVAKIDEDIVAPAKPKHLSELESLAGVLSS